MIRKHRDLIIRWANNHDCVVQVKEKDDIWIDVPHPIWITKLEYRVSIFNIEGNPVFDGDTLYNAETGEEVIIQVPTYYYGDYYAGQHNLTWNKPEQKDTREAWQDPETGLIWAVHPESDTYTWNDAIAKNWGNGWRIPTIQELVTIIDYSKTNPAIKAGLICKSNNKYFWSASMSVGSHTYAWGVNLNDGYVFDYIRISVINVRLVKGEMK